MSKAIIFKFGGASVKDAQSVKNLASILLNRLQNPFLIVVSAMGKSTNLLEEILKAKFSLVDYSSNIAILKEQHLQICRELFAPDHLIFAKIENTFLQLERELAIKVADISYDEYYDQIVCYGELLSTKIVQEYLCSQQIFCIWQDAREIISTDNRHRAAQVNWEKTALNCRKQLLPSLSKFPIITQGFIGRADNGKSTTLGREGSDFTAAILANCLDARSVTIWKDVPGVLNADPKLFPDTVLFPKLAYREAAEMTYYGASVIHPKTIKPLANKNIPLMVKSFINPDEKGTLITDCEPQQTVPTFVQKGDQILVTFRVKDFTFVNEARIHQIYAVLESLKIRVNLMQTSAISISLCLDKEFLKVEKLMQALKTHFEIRYNEDLKLLTVLHPQQEVISRMEEGKEILLEQKTRNTFQIVFREVSTAGA
ncbi:aspartate kinase [Litoribacter ruber]|uniref:aspartate kinase n=1 Tax=Litoribacter ruber TaxID=702568 RepID=UPI001BDA067E|nr:aspartate kinase [Litoribacter ruber]MBT0812797.1 aspartate kinase [Litoribacter ruber]